MIDHIFIADTLRDWQTFAIDQGWAQMVDGEFILYRGVDVSLYLGKRYVRLTREFPRTDTIRADFERVGTKANTLITRKDAEGNVDTWRVGNVRIQDDPDDPGPDPDNPRADYRPELAEHRWLTHVSN